MDVVKEGLLQEFQLSPHQEDYEHELPAPQNRLRWFPWSFTASQGSDAQSSSHHPMGHKTALLRRCCDSTHWTSQTWRSGCCAEHNRSHKQFAE